MKAIEVDDLRKTFGEREELRGVSLEVEKGDIFAFLGPNGAGKTTTMRILLGLLRPSSGTALVCEQDLATSTERSVLRTAWPVRAADGEREPDYFGAIWGARWWDGAGVLGRGLQGRMTVAELSTGLKRRVGLARALLREPELLFLDEPTSSLDPQAQRDFRELIVSLSRDRRLTVFLNTHDLDEAQRICNRVAILDQGRVRLIGRTEDLRAGRPQVEVVFPSEEEAREAERVLVADGRVNGTVRMGATLICDLTAPVSIRDLLNMGLEVKEFKSRSRGLDEVYFEVLEREAVA